jgi:hypothetical protein
MAAQKKYPDELRERAVKMLFEVRSGKVRGAGSWPGSHVSWVFTRRRCVPGQSRRKSTAERGPMLRPMISGGSRSWRRKTGNSAGLMRS